MAHYEAAGPVIEKSDDLYSAAVAAIAAVFGGQDEAAVSAPGWQVRAERFGPEIRLHAVPTDDERGLAEVAKMRTVRGLDPGRPWGSWIRQAEYDHKAGDAAGRFLRGEGEEDPRR